MLGVSGCHHPIKRHDEGRLDVLDRCGHPCRTYQFIRYRPPGYDDPARKDERWPLLLYLPGMLTFGSKVTRMGQDDPPGEIELGRDFPMVVITPMTPVFLELWSPELLLSLIDHAIEKERVDPNRVYVSGVSIGGVGAWDLAKAYPDRIAAIAPVAAWGDPRGIERMVDVPVWAFHGGIDFAIPPPLHLRMVKALRCAGGDPKCTVYPWGFHWIWEETYRREDLYRWMLDQSLEKRGVPRAVGAEAVRTTGR